MDGIDASLVEYFSTNNGKFQFLQAINKLAKKILTIGMNPITSKLLWHAKCFSLGKEKDGVHDADIRPIVIQWS